jgi:hypothetical protein
MIFPQLEVEIYDVWIWFINLSVDMVVTLQLGSGVDGEPRRVNAHVTHSEAKVMRYTASDVYSYSMQDQL